jgi:preprotein translocase subunit SecA
MFSSLARRLFGNVNDRVVRTYHKRLETINALEAHISALSDAQLQAKTSEFKDKIAKGATLDALLPEAFAVVREASKRILGMRHFDVQLIGGMVLHEGRIAEMRTGEGKTLVATLATYLNALSGKGVHVVTVNDYLAQRDAAMMGRLYGFLGLTTGVILHNLSDEQRQAAYGCDITYATNNELGFDYLRDNMKYAREMMVQRPFNFALVDEVDSILIDEARTPLIISGPVEDNSRLYVDVNAIIPSISPEDYDLDEKARSVTLTEDGTLKVEQLLVHAGLMPEGSSLYDIDNITVLHHVNQALKAHMLFKCDTDYLVKDNKVIIVDEFTGRMMEGRRYSDGLHQALEAKEKVAIQNENQTLASVTFQNYFRLYPKLAGMTGTAMTEANEFADIYRLEVVDIPTNLPVARVDDHDEIYRTRPEKYQAIARNIIASHIKQQPVLVGTVSIEQSEILSNLLNDKKHLLQMASGIDEEITAVQDRHKDLQKDTVKNKALLQEITEEIDALTQQQAFIRECCRKTPSKNTPLIPHNVLNARHHENEAQIIAQAGKPGGVTIATNMAGRGTDIKLGGNAEMLIEEASKNITDPLQLEALAQQIESQVRHDKDIVIKAGGLYVIGTERHESRRIDNQLRGRSGRQGDPGKSRFYISLEDDLMRIFGSERIDGMLQKLGLQEGEAIIHPWMNKAIERAQTKVEARNYDMRKNLLKYDDVMNDQRKVIFEQRIELMDADDVRESTDDMMNEIIGMCVAQHIPPRSYPEQWDAEGLHKEIFRLFGLHLPIQEWAGEEGIADAEIAERISHAAIAQQDAKDEEFGSELMKVGRKRLLLQTLDHLWKDHLHSLDHLRSGIHLRGYGQRDPLSEYKQEAFSLFEGMLAQLRELVTERLAHLQLRLEIDPQTLAAMQRQQQMEESRQDPALVAHDVSDDSSRTVGLGRVNPEDRNPTDPSTWGRVGRNEDCPCGSSKKYKHCHGTLE